MPPKLKRTENQNDLYDIILERSTPIQRKRLERNFETRNSAWLTVRISDRDNFCLSKSEFNDAIAMRYGLPLKAFPSKCDGCGSAFDFPHALSCKNGGLISLRHNEVRDVLGDLSSLAWSNVQKEPLIRSMPMNNQHYALIFLFEEFGVIRIRPRLIFVSLTLRSNP